MKMLTGEGGGGGGVKFIHYCSQMIDVFCPWQNAARYNHTSRSVPGDALSYLA